MSGTLFYMAVSKSLHYCSFTDSDNCSDIIIYNIFLPSRRLFPKAIFFVQLTLSLVWITRNDCLCKLYSLQKSLANSRIRVKRKTDTEFGERSRVSLIWRFSGIGYHKVCTWHCSKILLLKSKIFFTYKRKKLIKNLEGHTHI